MEATAFLNDPKVIPTSPRVYALFLRSGDELLSTAGHFPDPRLPAWNVDGRTHLYTGESFGLRQRLGEHLTGDISASTFRGSVLSLYWEAGARAGELPDFGDREATERALTECLAGEVVIGFKVCGYTREHQNAVLERTASPLNIADRPATPFSRLLSQFRSRFQSEVVSRWAPPDAPTKRRYRR